MRFKLFPFKSKHDGMSTCIGWLSVDEVVSAGDDQQLIFWNTTSQDVIRKIELSQDIFPTDLHVHPKPASVGRSSSIAVFLLASADGSFHIFDRNGHTEKSITGAHQGAVIVVRWSNDGTAIASGGEDGLIKIWSRVGMLRSTLSSHSSPVYELAWSSNSDSIVYNVENYLEIKSLSPKIKPLLWKAHDGPIIGIAWNKSNQMIISTGEDCRYKIWNENGRLIFTSVRMEYPIQSVSFSPDSSLIALGSFNTLLLCNQSGWTHKPTRIDVQTFQNLAWSNDSTQIVAATGSGNIILGHLVDRQMDWKTYHITITDHNMIQLVDIEKNIDEDFEFRENVTKISVGHGYLIVVTSAQCYVYRISNMSSPHSFNLKDQTVSLIIQSSSHFLLVDSANVNLCSYEGRYVDTLKWIGMRTDFLTNLTLSLSIDTVASIDANGAKTIYYIDIQSNTKSTPSTNQSYKHKMEIIQVALDKFSPSNERKCAFIDKNWDLYLSLVRHMNSGILRTIKCRSMMSYALWCDDASVLSGLTESGKLIVFLNPQAGFIDKDLLRMSVLESDPWISSSKTSQTVGLRNFCGNHLEIEGSDGSKVTTFISPMVQILHSYVAKRSWSEALRLCRYARNLPESWKLWAALAGMASQNRNLQVAEIAYSAINKVDKVLYMQEINGMSDKSARNAEIALVCGNLKEAESILVAARFILRAIQLNLDTYNWDRALELMNNHDRNQKYVPVILYHRKKYLERFNKRENHPTLKKLSEEHEIEDWSQVEAWMDNPYSERTEETHAPIPAARKVAKKPTESSTSEKLPDEIGFTISKSKKEQSLEPDEDKRSTGVERSESSERPIKTVTELAKDVTKPVMKRVEASNTKEKVKTSRVAAVPSKDGTRTIKKRTDQSTSGESNKPKASGESNKPKASGESNKPKASAESKAPTKKIVRVVKKRVLVPKNQKANAGEK
ncbi:intraflagellar transport protein Oseg5 isoform X2 [Brevipalpus obovatus]|uniref:intraflagellar transport protein Oseg5 isoform X2 n=1 Tax=Brevipalpus obovatus TaxID=246614 RepID=UPI003D9DD71C